MKTPSRLFKKSGKSEGRAANTESLQTDRRRRKSEQTVWRVKSSRDGIGAKH
jgi:hypothetical protein